MYRQLGAKKKCLIKEAKRISLIYIGSSKSNNHVAFEMVFLGDEVDFPKRKENSHQYNYQRKFELLALFVQVPLVQSRVYLSTF